MAQILTVASLLALLGWMGWRFASPARQQQPAIPRQEIEFERRVYKASAQDFLRGAADLTFGMVIFGLGFFMLMWVIATA